MAIFLSVQTGSLKRCFEAVVEIPGGMCEVEETTLIQEIGVEKYNEIVIIM